MPHAPARPRPRFSNRWAMMAILAVMGLSGLRSQEEHGPPLPESEDPYTLDIVFGFMESWKMVPHLGVLTSTTQRLSVELGLAWIPFRPDEGDLNWGPDGRFEIGTGGYKAKLGLEAMGDIHHFPLLGSISGALFWTHGHPVALRPHQTYFGVEADLCALPMCLRLQMGAFHHVNGENERPDWLFTIGMGFGV